MGAFTTALAPLLGATRLPLNAVTVLLGLAGTALGVWLIHMSRFFTGPSRPRSGGPASTTGAAGADDALDDDAPTDDRLVDDVSGT